MAISANDIKTLREETGAGILDCKKALEETGGDFERARALLREKGFRDAAKRAERATAEGTVEAYLHHNKRLGALVELNCETDFVARTEDFRTLAQQIALQVAGAAPLYISREEMPAGAEIDPKQACLLEQPFLQDESRTVQDLVSEVAAKTGENIRIRRFARFDLGR